MPTPQEIKDIMARTAKAPSPGADAIPIMADDEVVGHVTSLDGNGNVEGTVERPDLVVQEAEPVANPVPVASNVEDQPAPLNESPSGTVPLDFPIPDGLPAPTTAEEAEEKLLAHPRDDVPTDQFSVMARLKKHADEAAEALPDEQSLDYEGACAMMRDAGGELGDDNFWTFPDNRSAADVFVRRYADNKGASIDGFATIMSRFSIRR